MADSLTAVVTARIALVRDQMPRSASTAWRTTCSIRRLVGQTSRRRTARCATVDCACSTFRRSGQCRQACWKALPSKVWRNARPFSNVTGKSPRERDSGDLSERILAMCPDLEGHEVWPRLCAANPVAHVRADPYCTCPGTQAVAVPSSPSSPGRFRNQQPPFAAMRIPASRPEAYFSMRSASPGR